MKNFRNYILTFILAVFGGIFLSVMYVNPYDGSITLSELILQITGSRGEFVLSFSMNDLLSFSMRLMPFFLLQAYLGIAVYRHFCTASIYVFSRCPNRGKWYWKEMCSVMESVLIFVGILLLSTVFTSKIRYAAEIDDAGILLAVYYFFLYGFWVYKMIVLLNLAALWCGSGTAYVIVLGVQMVEMALLAIENMGQSGSFYQEGTLLQYNPIARLVFGWQSSENDVLSNVLPHLYEGLNINGSLLIQIITCGIVLAAGCVLVKKHNLLISDAEMGV